MSHNTIDKATVIAEKASEPAALRSQRLDASPVRDTNVASTGEPNYPA